MLIVRPLMLFAALFLATSARAQTVPAQPITPQSAYDSFQRVVLSVNKPLSELSRSWPASLDGQPRANALMLSAAHTIRISTRTDSDRNRDTTQRVASVTYVERFSDTLAFKTRIVALMAELSAKLGAPDECSLPIGPPAYVQFPQNPARIWRKGFQETRTVLDWEVTSTGMMLLTVRVGRFVDALGEKFLCTVALP